MWLEESPCLSSARLSASFFLDVLFAFRRGADRETLMAVQA